MAQSARKIPQTATQPRHRVVAHHQLVSPLTLIHQIVIATLATLTVASVCSLDNPQRQTTTNKNTTTYASFFALPQFGRYFSALRHCKSPNIGVLLLLQRGDLVPRRYQSRTNSFSVIFSLVQHEVLPFHLTMRSHYSSRTERKHSQLKVPVNQDNNSPSFCPRTRETLQLCTTAATASRGA